MEVTPMDYQAQIEYTNQNNPFMTHSGITVTSLKLDQAQGQLNAGPEQLNIIGSVHGGALFTLADCLAGLAARSNGGRYTTLDSSFHYLKAGKPGVIYGQAEMVHRGRSTCVVRVQITQEERLLAEGTFTMFCLRQPEPQA